jgi:DNA polymerase III delta subunit
LELNEFKTRLKSGNLGGCYIFAGEEDYLKRYYMRELATAAGGDDSFAVFNRASFDGREVDFGALYDAVSSPPMMSDYKYIEWKYPSFDKMKESELLALEKLLSTMDEGGYTVLAFLVAEGEIDLGTPKRPSKFVRRFGDKIGILSFDKSTDAQLVGWLAKHFEKEGIRADRHTLEALVFRSGRSMQILNNEVIKLSAYARARGLSEISESEVMEVASRCQEADAFALSNAVLSRNKKAAYDALADLKGRRVEPLVIISMLAKIYSELVAVSMLLSDGMSPNDIEAELKMNRYKLKLYLGAAKKFDGGRAARILEELSRVDAASKFGGISGYAAVEIFVAKCV